MSLSADHQRSKTLGDVLAVKDLEKKEGQYSRPLQWLNINLLVISLFHVATIWALFSGTFNQTMLVLTLVAIWVRMFALNGGYHRYFSHRSFQTSRIFAFILAFVGGCSFQGGALWWGSHHRFHHKHADTVQDIHSPTLKGFLWSHVGWFLFSEDNLETLWPVIPDLAKHSELVWLNDYYWVPVSVFTAGIFAVWGVPGFLWGVCVSTVILWHITFCINSLAHVHGSVRYNVPDTSKNNWFLALMSMGEGWHNNHHAYRSSANMGFFWWELDVTFYILRGLELLGLVWDLRLPPLEELGKTKEFGRDKTYL